MATRQLLRIARPALCRPVLHPRLLHSTPATREHYINATKADFDRLVLHGPADRVVLVDFYADWCGPCHTLSPILKNLTSTRAAGSGSKLDLVTIDIEDESGGQELAQQFKVRALPTVVAFRGGESQDRFVGALNEGGVKQFLDKL
ncbi:thioredoxin-like protein [Mycena vulgaris]|nr:thioredoxin-like protein [Mycena vulgaris]